jgi:hypothetical protein
MKRLMPLKRFVVDITMEAKEENEQSIRKVVRSWHNRLANGTIPRTVVTKLGRELFVDLEAWNKWLLERQKGSQGKNPGRPRTA